MRNKTYYVGIVVLFVISFFIVYGIFWIDGKATKEENERFRKYPHTIRVMGGGDSKGIVYRFVSYELVDGGCVVIHDGMKGCGCSSDDKFDERRICGTYVLDSK